MIFVTTAGEIQAAHKAGLLLTEIDGRGEWMGDGTQWDVYTKLIAQA